MRMIMTRPAIAPRLFVLVVTLAVALVSSSCVSGTGMGVGVGAPARWSGSTGSPPVFAGGPP
jgi:hypothetical protein